MIGLVDVGSARLFVTTRGAGPTMLLISGATGDAGDWTAVARMLASEFTVVTYDRRGMSRSPRPDGWTATSVAQQADDAAGLLRGLQLAPAVVVGQGDGGSIACELVAHHPGLVRQAVAYEPLLFAAIEDGRRIVADRLASVEPVLVERGHRAAMEAFLRGTDDGSVDPALSSLDAEHLDRILDNGAVFLSFEVAAFASYLPDADRLRASGTPVAVVIREDGRERWTGAIGAWLAERAGAARWYLPGGPSGGLTHADAFVALLCNIVHRGGRS
jgi:pimeloyl-ACP methyl ester carboxylesterase